MTHFSASSHGTLHGCHMYGATKYAVTALAEGLRQELRSIKSGIRFSVRFDEEIAAYYNDFCLL